MSTATKYMRINSGRSRKCRRKFHEQEEHAQLLERSKIAGRAFRRAERERGEPACALLPGTSTLGGADPAAWLDGYEYEVATEWLTAT